MRDIRRERILQPRVGYVGATEDDTGQQPA